MDIRRDFAEYLYSRLPKVYRYHDKEGVLKAFIETFVEGGFNKVIDDNLKLFDLLDVDNCPKKYLPLLASSYGLTYTEEIPELFYRRLLKNITNLYQRKGTKSAIRFLARELTGFDTEIIENKDFSDVDIEASGWDIRFEHYRNFILKLKAPYETSLLDVKEEVIKVVINDFLPTNSNVLVVTSYWFQDDHNHTRYTIEKAILDTLKEYNEYTKSVFDFLSVENNHMTDLTKDDGVITIPVTQIGFVRYENSLLNQSVIGNTLFTNGLLFRELVKDIWYESSNPTKDSSFTVINRTLAHLITETHSSEHEIVKDISTLEINNDTENYVKDIQIINKSNHSQNEGIEIDLPSIDSKETIATSELLECGESEILGVVSSTQTRDYGILNLTEETDTYSDMKVEGDNSIIGDSRYKLNKFYTNGLLLYDKVTVGDVSYIIIL